jgi:hypothetical protein
MQQIASVMEIAVRVAGVLLVGLALAHVFLPKLLGWREDVAKLRLINQHVFFAHALFIVVGIFLLGLICIVYPQALVDRSTLGLIATGAFTLCWFSRLCFQFIVFRGDITGTPKLDMAMHFTGTLLWLAFTIIFGSVFWYQWNWK